MTIGESDDRQAWAHDIKNKGSSVLQPLRAFRVWPQSHWPHLMICSPSFSPFWLHKPSFCYSTISSSFQLQGLCTCWALHLKLFPIGPLHDWFCLFFLSGFSLNVTSSEIPSIISQLNAAPCHPKSPSIPTLWLSSRCQRIKIFACFCLPYHKKGRRDQTIFIHAVSQNVAHSRCSAGFLIEGRCFHGGEGTAESCSTGLCKATFPSGKVLGFLCSGKLKGRNISGSESPNRVTGRSWTSLKG